VLSQKLASHQNDAVVMLAGSPSVPYKDMAHSSTWCSRCCCCCRPTISGHTAVHAPCTEAQQGEALPATSVAIASSPSVVWQALFFIRWLLPPIGGLSRCRWHAGGIGALGSRPLCHWWPSRSITMIQSWRAAPPEGAVLPPACQRDLMHSSHWAACSTMLPSANACLSASSGNTHSSAPAGWCRGVCAAGVHGQYMP
jgi:hypothetical protein